MKRHRCGYPARFTRDGDLAPAILHDGKMVYDCPGCGEKDAVRKYLQWRWDGAPGIVGVDLWPTLTETDVIYNYSIRSES
jgi:hypothetical protein